MDTVDDKQTRVEFDSADLDVRTVPSRFVIPLTGAISRPYLVVASFICYSTHWSYITAIPCGSFIRLLFHSLELFCV